MPKRKKDRGVRLVREVLKKTRRRPATGPSFSGAPDVFKYLKEALRDGQQEAFLALLLDVKNRVIRTEMIGLGTLDATIVHPREVFRPAIQASAAGVIAVHNHPSGDPEPSDEDLELTRRLAEAGRLVGIPLLDHIIVGADGFVSLAERGVV